MRVGNTVNNQELFQMIEKRFSQAERQERVVTTPAGAVPSEIYWLKSERIWANLVINRKGTALLCQFGSELPDDQNQRITMDVQINLSLAGAGSLGAALLDEDNKLYFGHRGELRGGRTNVTALEFRQRIRRFTPQNVTSGTTVKSYFVLGSPAQHDFVVDLARYVRECRRIRTEVRGLAAEDADDRPEPIDAAGAVERRNISIKNRRGQQAFRNALLSSYKGTCVISRCRVLDVLEAAHLAPFAGVHTNNLNNGLLLRADLHTLLDCDLLAVDPATRRVVFSSKVRSSSNYKPFQGVEILEPTKREDRPSKENLTALMKKLIT